MAKVSINEWEKEVPKETTLLTLDKQEPSLPITFSCRAGSCGICAVEVRQGEENLSKPTRIEQETLNRIWKGRPCRLACQCMIHGDVDLNPLYRP